MTEWGPGPYQVSLSIEGTQLVSKHVAKVVSLELGGNGEVELIDRSWWADGQQISSHVYNVWMINLPAPFDGGVDVVDEHGFSCKVVVETTLP